MAQAVGGSGARMRRTIGEYGRLFVQLAGGYWSGKDKWSVRFWSALLVSLTVIQVFVPILTNLWNKSLFDALEARSMDRFMTMLFASLGIILLNVVVTVLHLKVKRGLQLGWRHWITSQIVKEWLTQGRHHQITHIPGEHDNPDGRIAEDVRIITEYAVDLAMSLLYCVLLLISFVNILWILSGAPEVTLMGLTFTVPGYLIYIAILYAGAGTTIAMLIGKPMVRAADTRQSREADFRFGLAGVRENAQKIALLHGESHERRHLFDLFRGVISGWNGQTNAIAYWMIFSSAYSVLSMAFPLLVVSPRYISGAISLGMLMQTAQAFQQTAAALSWPVDSLARVAEWKASGERVLNLVHAVEVSKKAAQAAADQRIVVDRIKGDPDLAFQGVRIDDPDGSTVIDTFDLEVKPGDRVLIGGDPNAAIRLFRAVARVWPWGRGRIRLPDDKHVFFMPERPFLPRGTLREILSYPREADIVGTEAAADALRLVGLGHLVEEIDVIENWHDALAVADQQRLGFARLFVLRPDWIFIQNATDNLPREEVSSLFDLMEKAFPNVTILTIGSHSVLPAHHNRRIMLERVGTSVRPFEVDPMSTPTNGSGR